MPLQATSGAASYDAFGGGVAAVPNYIEDVFSTWLYTGNGSTQTITNGVDLSTKGGLVWAKPRSSATSHCLIDTARGTGKIIYSDATAAQATDANALTAFNTTGYSMGGSGQTNSSGVTYASWTFRKQPKFFDVVTWSGTGGSRAISHALDSTPGCIIIKRTDSTDAWYVVHRSLPSGFSSYLTLNTTNASVNGSDVSAVGSSTFTVSNYYNASGATWVAYLFAHDAGGFGLTGTDNVISCGSFTTDGSGNATVNLGYEPQLVMYKRADGAGSWAMFDNMRGMTVNTTNGDAILFANLSDAESTVDWIQPTATGFNPYNIAWNATYIYIAIRRGPMKVPTDGTKVFNPALEWTPNSNIMGYLGAPADFGWIGYRNGASINVNARTRLTGGNRLSTSSTAAEISDSTNYWDNQLGFNQTAGTPTSIYAMWTGRRAPGFFDVVCYTGTGAASQTLSHNLTVVPELMIVKARSYSQSWVVYVSSLGNTSGLLLGGTNATLTGRTDFWNSTTPTATVFSVGDAITASGTYVAYLFATCPGVSKVGSYTGTGTTQTINCGFTGGARFVLIKRTDSTGDWYVWDSARGIVAGNDPYLLLNSTAAEVTSTDYVDTYSAGFEISSTAPAAINASGGSFIFLAIA